MSLLDVIGAETTKGALLHQIGTNSGVPLTARLDVTGTATDAETIVVGSETFYLANCTAAIGGGAVTANDEWNNTTATINATITSHGLDVGTLLLVASEFAIVTAVVDDDTVTVLRGYAGSTIAVHADSVAITSQTTATPAGNFPVPLSAPTTAATITTQIVAAFNAFTGQQLTALDGGDNAVLIHGWTAVTVSETMSNGAFLGGAFLTGTVKGEQKVAAVTRTIASGEAVPKFVFPFTVLGTYLQVRNASGVVKAHDGLAVISGNVVTLDNSGSTDAVATDVVTLVAFG